MNEHRTRSNSDTPLARGNPGSFSARYDLIDKDGRVIMNHENAAYLGSFAKSQWPYQSQDPDRTGKGWTIQAVDPVHPPAERGPVQVVGGE